MLVTKEITEAASILQSGGVGVFPTDTVYALGCSAFDRTALQKLYRLRKRPFHKPLQIHISEIEQLREFVSEIPPVAKDLMTRYWPGPLTIVFKCKQDSLPELVTAGGDTVAIRWPDCDLELALIRQAGVPLVAPSANPSSYPPALTVEEACHYFGSQCDFYVDGGDSKHTQVSTIVDVSQPEPCLLRKGIIALSARELMIE